MACPASNALSSQRLQLVADYLSAPEAFGLAKVCRAFAKSIHLLDAKVFLLRLRPKTWRNPGIEELSQEFCRRLLRDWHVCLKNSACQVAYVLYDQHLIFVEANSQLAPSPQGADPFPVSIDQESYTCSIEEFHWNCLWWKCLENELFHWPQEVMKYHLVEGRPVLNPELLARGGYEDESHRLGTSEARGPGRLRVGEARDGGRRSEDDRDRPDFDIDGRRRGDEDDDGEVSQRAIQRDLATVVVPNELEAVPGYCGDMSLPNLEEDVLAVLSLNAAWFQYSFWTRQLQAILLLRDGRFLLIGSCEMQGTINSQAESKVNRCFVSDSLMSIVTFAQDPRSREILRTTLPGSHSESAERADEQENEKKPPRDLEASMRTVKLPRCDAENSKAIEAQYGTFLKVSKESFEDVLFSTRQMNQPELRKAVKVGDRVRAKRAGETFIWSSCQKRGPEDQFPAQGPVDPDGEEEFLHKAHGQDRRWLTYSGGCHLGLKEGRSYEAQVEAVLESGCVDLRYTNPREWANGNSGFTNGDGADRTDGYVEADVVTERLHMMPTSDWYWSFKQVWEGCGAFSSVSLSFGSSGTGSVRCFVSAGGTEPGSKEVESAADDLLSFRKLADALADTLPSHRFRCQTLAQESALLPDQQEAIEELRTLGSAGGAMPRQRHMAAGKQLFLKLLRVPAFWKKWVDLGGESPAKVTTLFKKEKFVRLIIQ